MCELVIERARGEKREEGKWWLWEGEAREQVFPQADQEYSAHIVDDTGGKEVTGGRPVLALLYQLLVTLS